MSVDKLVDSTQLDADLTSVANAIRAKTGGTADLQFPADFVSEIGSISGGEVTPAPLKDVVFFDYDGTPLYSYTYAEANALTELPANPSHKGLTAQGWNWTLQDIKDQITECPDGDINVGQSYVTDDGKTRIYITIPYGTDAAYMTFCVRFRSSAIGNVTIDWGDGYTETNTETADTTYPHTYSAVGDYMITLAVSSGTLTFYGNTIYSPVFGEISNWWNHGRVTKIEVGTNTALSDYAFYNCYHLRTVTIPVNVSALGPRVFQDDRALVCAVIPRTVTRQDYLVFNGTTNLMFVCVPKALAFPRTGNSPVLKRATLTNAGAQSGALYSAAISRIGIPTSGINTITNQLFYSCTLLSKVTIPSNITSLASECFRGCSGIREYHFQPTTPPTLANTNAFTGINANTVIYVPYSEDHSILEAYQTATNWSTYASYMQEETP